MNNIIANYRGTEGRISRQPFWIGAIILGVIQILITIIILPAVGLGTANVAALQAGGTDTAAMSEAVVASLSTSAWASLVLFLIFAYPFYALMVKRRHDRDNNGLDALIYLVLLAVFLLIQALGLAYSVAEVSGVVIPAPTTVYSIFSVIVGIYAIYMLVVLGFLKGTAGPNQYGPDPLGGA